MKEPARTINNDFCFKMLGFVKSFLLIWVSILGFAKELLLEPISKIRLEVRARRETVKERSIHVVCEHFEPFRNAAHGHLDCF